MKVLACLQVEDSRHRHTQLDRKSRLKLCAKHQNRVASIAEVVVSEKFPRVLRGVGSFGLDGF